MEHRNRLGNPRPIGGQDAALQAAGESEFGRGSGSVDSAEGLATQWNETPHFVLPTLVQAQKMEAESNEKCGICNMP